MASSSRPGKETRTVPPGLSEIQSGTGAVQGPPDLIWFDLIWFESIFDFIFIWFDFDRARGWIESI